MRILGSLLSLSVLVLALPAQEKPSCCMAQGAATAAATPSPQKALTALAAELKALPQARKAELAAAAKTMSEVSPGGRGAVQLLSVLGAAGARVSDCCALPGASHAGDGAENAALEARVTGLRATLEAQVAVLAELGVKLPEQASCCAAGDESAQKDGAKTPEHCFAELQKSFAGIPAATKALDEASRAKVTAAVAVLEAAKVTTAMHEAFGYYARELTAVAKELDGAQERAEAAAEGGCPVGQDMADSAAPLAETAHALAKLTNTFLASASLGEEDCSGGSCCEAGKAAGKACCQQKAAAPKSN